MMFYIIFDLMMALIIFLVGLYFYRSHGKAANLLSGYNMRSAQERKQFDETAMCRIYGKHMMFMVVPFLIGALVDFFHAGTGCIIAWICFIILWIFLMVERSKLERRKD